MLICGFVYVRNTIGVCSSVEYFKSFFSCIKDKVLGIFQCCQDMKDSVLLGFDVTRTAYPKST